MMIIVYGPLRDCLHRSLNFNNWKFLLFMRNIYIYEHLSILQVSSWIYHPPFSSNTNLNAMNAICWWLKSQFIKFIRYCALWSFPYVSWKLCFICVLSVSYWFLNNAATEGVLTVIDIFAFCNSICKLYWLNINTLHHI